MRRPERLAEVLREEVTEIVGYELKDPRLQAVTVTDVRVSENMRDAKIYVVVEGDEKEIRDVLRALQNAATFVRQQVALNLDLRHAPHLNFIRDTVEENAARVEELIVDLTQKGEFQERKDSEG
ncbi:MAG: 30S ribosome-binding factor RbfA [Acidobacteriota bacterium]|jgi:ribosome-binding factor A|nr:30S ribosome-binding factor RbfA [Acidobacteriota bacterium]MDQ3372638.1 30S ribosome-binding factor RbfA [Acidobacteriota bacterium]